MEEGINFPEKEEISVEQVISAYFIICFIFILMSISFIIGGVVSYFSFSKTKITTKTVVIEKPIYISLNETVTIPNNGSLCGTLKMTEAEALAFANKFNYPLRYNSWGQLNVILQPGEKFKKTWQPDTLKYLVKK